MGFVAVAFDNSSFASKEEVVIIVYFSPHNCHSKQLG
jgi:hypothetical protein